MEYYYVFRNYTFLGHMSIHVYGCPVPVTPLDVQTEHFGSITCFAAPVIFCANPFRHTVPDTEP